MSRTTSTILTALAVIGALLLVDHCAERRGARQAEARARDTQDDSTVSRLVHEAAVAEQRFSRERDSTGRVIANLRSRLRTPTVKMSADSGVSDEKGCKNAPAVCDTLILSYEAGRAQDSLQILFWKAHVAQRDSLIPRLTQSRDAWREQAQRPRYTVTDIGGGAIAGWGLAERNQTAVLVGAGVVLVPRLVGAVKRGLGL